MSERQKPRGGAAATSLTRSAGRRKPRKRYSPADDPRRQELSPLAFHLTQGAVTMVCDAAAKAWARAAPNDWRVPFKLGPHLLWVESSFFALRVRDADGRKLCMRYY